MPEMANIEVTASDVMINGRSLYTSAEHPITVAPIDPTCPAYLAVTLTLLADRVVIDQSPAASA